MAAVIFYWLSFQSIYQFRKIPSAFCFKKPRCLFNYRFLMPMDEEIKLGSKFEQKLCLLTSCRASDLSTSEGGGGRPKQAYALSCTELCQPMR